jgi:hypothetical protein
MKIPRYYKEVDNEYLEYSFVIRYTKHYYNKYKFKNAQEVYNIFKFDTKKQLEKHIKSWLGLKEITADEYFLERI